MSFSIFDALFPHTEAWAINTDCEIFSGLEAYANYLLTSSKEQGHVFIPDWELKRETYDVLVIVFVISPFA